MLYVVSIFQASIRRLGETRKELRNHTSQFDVKASIPRNWNESPLPTDDEVVIPIHRNSLNPRGQSGMISTGIDSSDNVHSPYFLHSSDHPSLAIVIHTLDGTKYNNWAIGMGISLDAKNKIVFVDGSLQRPDVANHFFKIWSRCNTMVKA